jgi:hypothetical protein
MLVSSLKLLKTKPNYLVDIYYCSFLVWIYLNQDTMGSNRGFSCNPSSFHPQRNLYCKSPDHSGLCPEVSRCTPYLLCPGGLYVSTLDGSFLYTSICACSSWLVSCISRINTCSYELWVWSWWFACRMASYQSCWKLLHVCFHSPEMPGVTDRTRLT